MTTQQISRSVFSASILFHLALLLPFMFLSQSGSMLKESCISLSLVSAANSPEPVSAPPEPAPKPVQPRPEPVPVQQKPVQEQVLQKELPEPETAIPATSSQGAPPHCARQESAANNASAYSPQAAPAPASGQYLSIIRERVEARKHYPSFARKLQQEGTVVVNVVIGTDGLIISSRLVNSSGYAMLDKAALKAVRKAAPFPPPTGYGLGQISIDIPLVFELI